MTEPLLVQDVFLLAHDDQSGKNDNRFGLSAALAAALLLDLAEAGAVTVEDGIVRRTDTRPSDGLLDRAALAIDDEPEPRPVARWLGALPKALKPLDKAVGESLVTRGVLEEQHEKTLGLFNSTRWPQRDPEPEQRLRSDLFGVLVEGAEPTPRDLLLAALLYQHGMIDGLVDKPDRKAARTRAKDLAARAESGDSLSKALGESVRAAQAAIVAATTVATTAAVTTAAMNN